jgi:SAM-dependent methyltransferase
MFKYVAVSTAAKAFSLNSATKVAYRRLGNVALERMRVAGGLDPKYTQRAVRLIDYCDDSAILSPGDAVLELGTGWLHWEATVLRLFNDVRVTLYDVTDNRLLGAYKSWVGQLRDQIDVLFAHLPAERRDVARELAGIAMAVESFEELYARMGFEYVLDPTGMLAGVPRGAFQLVVSSDVMEHVAEQTLADYLVDMRDCLRPGGWSIHQIDIVDHYHYFDPKTSPKNYYRYEESTWRRWFDSDVQYFNRVQRPTWLALFSGAGFELVEESSVSEPLAPVRLAARFRDLAAEDRDCMQLITVHRQPGGV